MTSRDRDKPLPGVDLRRLRHRDQRRQVTLDRLDKIIYLRSTRTPWRDIAAEVGVSYETCRRTFNQYLADRAAELDENLLAHRQEIAETLDVLLRIAVRDALTAPTVTERCQAAATALRCTKQIIDLFGLAAPRRLEARVDVVATAPIDVELAALVEQLGLDAGGGE